MFIFKIILIVLVFNHLNAKDEIDIQLLNDHLEKMQSLSDKINELIIKYQLTLSSDANNI